MVFITDLAIYSWWGNRRLRYSRHLYISSSCGEMVIDDTYYNLNQGLVLFWWCDHIIILVACLTSDGSRLFSFYCLILPTHSLWYFGIQILSSPVILFYPLIIFFCFKLISLPLFTNLKSASAWEALSVYNRCSVTCSSLRHEIRPFSLFP